MTVWTSLLGWFRYSLYLALSCDSLEEVVHSELWDKFYLCKTECFSWNKWNEREPGLFKSEFKGTRVIALCRKFYFAKNEKGEKVKLSSKGVQQHRIKLHWDWCKAALEGGVDTTTNRGMRMNGGVMSIYEQDKCPLWQTLCFGRQNWHQATSIPHRGRGALGAGAVGWAMRWAAAWCGQAGQEVPHEQSHAWGCCANDTKSVHWGW